MVYIMLLYIFFCLLYINFSLRLHITFVARNGHYYILSTIVFELENPLFYFIKGLCRCYLICNDSPYSISIINWSNGVIFFLTSSILLLECMYPYCKLNTAIICEFLYFFKIAGIHC